MEASSVCRQQFANIQMMITAVTHKPKTVVKLKPEKNAGLNGIRTHDLCHTGAVTLPTELSSQFITDIPAEGEVCK